MQHNSEKDFRYTLHLLIVISEWRDMPNSLSNDGFSNVLCTRPLYQVLHNS